MKEVIGYRKATWLEKIIMSIFTLYNNDKVVPFYMVAVILTAFFLGKEYMQYDIEWKYFFVLLVLFIVLTERIAHCIHDVMTYDTTYED